MTIEDPFDQNDCTLLFQLLQHVNARTTQGTTGVRSEANREGSDRCGRSYRHESQFIRKAIDLEAANALL